MRYLRFELPPTHRKINQQTRYFNCTLSRKESSFDRKVIIGQSFKLCYPGAIADYPTFWNLPVIMATPWAVIVVLSNNLKDKYLT